MWSRDGMLVGMGEVEGCTSGFLLVFSTLRLHAATTHLPARLLNTPGDGPHLWRHVVKGIAGAAAQRVID